VAVQCEIGRDYPWAEMRWLAAAMLNENASSGTSLQKHWNFYRESFTGFETLRPRANCGSCGYEAQGRAMKVPS